MVKKKHFNTAFGNVFSLQKPPSAFNAQIPLFVVVLGLFCGHQLRIN